MATLYRPKFQIFINGFDVSVTIEPYLISINIEETFDTSFSPTKLELIFHAKYTRSSRWQYKDTITVKLWWEPFPLFFYQSPTFYVDYIDDSKEAGGLQTFRVSAMAADPNLGFGYGANELSFTNTSIVTAVNSFATVFGLTLFQNLATNVTLGTIKDITNTTDPPDLNICTIDFTSYADMLKYICETYGYFGDLRGTTLRLFAIETAVTDTSRFFVWDLNELFSFNAKQTFTQLYKEYQCFYVERPANTFALGSTQPLSQAQLNNRTNKIDFNDAYNNVTSATRRLYAELLKNYLNGFEVVLSLSGLPEFTAGNVFLLDADYGNHRGYYRCTKCIHKVDGSGWISELTGYPIAKPEEAFASFTVGYLGQTNIPPASNTLTVSTNLGGTLSSGVLTGSQLDAYAKDLNPNYTQNLGATFITEGNKAGNNIRADIAFCIALYESRNFTLKMVLDTFNPGRIATAGGQVSPPHNFSNWNNGVRGQIQQMFAYRYATGSPADTIISPRYSFVTRGIAPSIDQLVDRWNDDLDFGTIVKSLLKGLYQKRYPTTTIIIS
jgi:hypothetical protein